MTSFLGKFLLGKCLVEQSGLGQILGQMSGGKYLWGNCLSIKQTLLYIRLPSAVQERKALVYILVGRRPSCLSLQGRLLCTENFTFRPWLFECTLLINILLQKEQFPSFSTPFQEVCRARVDTVFSATLFSAKISAEKSGFKTFWHKKNCVGFRRGSSCTAPSPLLDSPSAIKCN